VPLPPKTYMPAASPTIWKGTNRDKRMLLEVARRALTLAAERGETLADLPEGKRLREPGGAFVTLRRRGRLRGCIGQLPSKEALVRVVAYCAKGAALEDPRFEPVRADEVPGLDVEVSVISPLEEMSPECIEPGTHGLVISKGWERGVLLPQVAAERGWTAERFLEETCAKAGLERDAWKNSATRIQAFTADVFSESDFESKDD
jgi:AmmeMemoRadiSam system protein A